MNLKDLFITINTAYYGSYNSREAMSYKGIALRILELIKDVDLLLLDEVSESDDDNDNMTRCTLSFYAHSQYMKLV
jgi:hypothetical protein